MKLGELMSGLAEINKDCEITGLTLDSRQIKGGELFVALPGSVTHGMAYAKTALNNGAAAIVYDPQQGGREVAQTLENDNVIAVEGLATQLGRLADHFYQQPSNQLDVLGITGTNGKTSCSQFLAQILPDTGVIGTLGWGKAGDLQSTLNTTPDVISVHRMLAQLKQQKVHTVAMEVSSHGLHQGRVDAVRFKGALFTNLSRDHLDYHGSMQAYLEAKVKLLRWPDLEFAVINFDSEYRSQILQHIADQVTVWGFSTHRPSGSQQNQIWAENIKYELAGTKFELCSQTQRIPVCSELAGRFNLENILAVATVMSAMQYSAQQVAEAIAGLQPVAGRMMHFGGRDLPSIFIDYAHTPDALQKLLASLRTFSTQQLVVVFGCGGERDQGKRAQMGDVASRWADRIVVTNDNPRSENPESIAEDILQGCKRHKVALIHDRRLAIMQTIQQAQVGDCVVIAGKGHEQYQEINGERIAFDDSDIARQALSEWGARCN